MTPCFPNKRKTSDIYFKNIVDYRNVLAILTNFSAFSKNDFIYPKKR